MQQVVVKIDLCGSKSFAAKNESRDPLIRTDALKRLLQISQRCFPDSTVPYPEGSFYKADGDAIYYVLEKPSVALRGAIEFMQLWFHEAVPRLPDCRVFLDRGSIDQVPIAGRVELTGRAFENIAVVEKGRQEGRVYATEMLVDSVDATMVKFAALETVTPRPGDAFKLYCVDFDDPRTVQDSSLVHALFVAHPQAAEARDRIFDLFVVEYLLHVSVMTSLSDFVEWARTKEYSLPSRDHLERLLTASTYVERHNAGWKLTDAARHLVDEARTEYADAKRGCVQIIEKALVQATRRDTAATGLDLAEMAEEYLCAMFAEVRLMANYFRSTLQLFDSPPDQFDRFDYLLRQHLDSVKLAYYSDWRQGFISGLKQTASTDNQFIAAVFHNVLATYYLNRSGQASSYQVERLRERQIYLDTNVLYSLCVEASPFHEVTAYFVERLAKLDIRLRVLPISVWEYEESLLFVERNYDDRGPREIIVRRNPWLYQQFMADKGRYVSSMAVCRQEYSVAKDLPVDVPNYGSIDSNLRSKGLELEREATELSQEEADSMWEEHRNWMTSNKWDLQRYWDFINQEFPPSVRRHDMTCLANLASKAESLKADAMGPKVVFITVDGKLCRLRKRYPFICSPAQFLEFILPYLFLSDIPLTDARRFPNRLLSAQLGTLLVKRPPQLAEIVRAYFQNPSLAKREPTTVIANLNEDMARVLNSQRFRQFVAESETLTPGQRDEFAAKAAGMLEELSKVKEQATADAHRVDELESELDDRETTIARLQRTLAYWRAQAKRK